MIYLVSEEPPKGGETRKTPEAKYQHAGCVSCESSPASAASPAS